LPIDETSKIEVKVNNVVVSTTHKDLNDAWADAINRLMQSGGTAVLTQTVTIKKT
jgi:hypothetical protein